MKEKKKLRLPSRFDIDTWLTLKAGKFDTEKRQPIQLGLCLLVSKNFGDGYRKFIRMRHKLRQYMDRVAIMPFIVQDANEITFRDNGGQIVEGTIETPEDLSRLIFSDPDRLGPLHYGTVHVSFKDDSELAFSVPMLTIIEPQEAE